MKRRRNASHIEEAGVRGRLFRRGDRYWLDVRLGEKRERLSAQTSDRTIAEKNARALAKEIATQLLLGVSPQTITLGEVFGAYHRHKVQTLKKQWKKGAETRTKMFRDGLGRRYAGGRNFPVER
jgi:hypothetical protein